MLESAYFHKEEVAEGMKRMLRDEEYYKFFNISQYINYEGMVTMDSSFCSEACGISKVSIDKGEVIGFMTAHVNYQTKNVTNMTIAKFDKDKNPIIFMRDMERFIKYLFIERNIHKISFNAVVDNIAANRLCKYFINKYGGSVVGILKEDVILTDNRYYDLILYEILRPDYIRSLNILSRSDVDHLKSEKPAHKIRCVRNKF